MKILDGILYALYKRNENTYGDNALSAVLTVVDFCIPLMANYGALLLLLIVSDSFYDFFRHDVTNTSIIMFILLNYAGLLIYFVISGRYKRISGKPQTYDLRKFRLVTKYWLIGSIIFLVFSFFVGVHCRFGFLAFPDI